MLFPASFKLALMCCSCMHHLLPCVASLQPCHASYLVEHHALFMCGVFTMLCASSRQFSFRCNREDLFVYAWFVFAASSVRRLHGLVLLPSGISGKMTVTLDLITIIAMLVALFYRYAALPITCSSSLPNCHEPLTFVTLPSKPLFGYVTAFAQPLLQRCQLQVKMKIAPCWIMFMLGYHNISYLINASIYLVKGGRLGLMPGVLFHSCRPSSVIPVLCSLILRS